MQRTVEMRGAKNEEVHDAVAKLLGGSHDEQRTALRMEYVQGSNRHLVSCHNAQSLLPTTKYILPAIFVFAADFLAGVINGFTECCAMLKQI